MNTRKRSTTTPKDLTETRLPTLAEDCIRLNTVAAGVLAGTVPVDRARVAFPIMRQSMRRYDYAIQIGRLNPAARHELPSLLGLPEPKNEETTVKTLDTKR